MSRSPLYARAFVAVIATLPLAIACTKTTSFTSPNTDPSRDKAGGKPEGKTGNEDGSGRKQGNERDANSTSNDTPPTAPEGMPTGNGTNGTAIPGPMGGSGVNETNGGGTNGGASSGGGTNGDASSGGGTNGGASSGGGTNGGASNGGGTTVERPLPPTDVIDQGAKEAKASCEAPGAKKSTIVREIVFPARTATCPFGSSATEPDAAGNLAPGEQDRISARVEETRSLELPAGARLCGLRVFTPGTTDASRRIRFNDEIILTFNGVVVASSFNYNAIMLGRPAARGEWVPFRWKPLRGFQFDKPPLCADPAKSKYGCYQSTEKSVYCLGADDATGTCALPKTESTNVIRVEFGPALSHRFSALAKDAGGAEFGLVTLGDNDVDAKTDAAADCTRTEFRFKAEAEIVLP